MNESENQFGRDATTLVSDHSNDAVVTKHYRDQMVAVKNVLTPYKLDIFFKKV